MIFLGWVTGCLGLTLGYHRLLSHKAFEVPKWLERVFATCGALSAEYGPIEWVGYIDNIINGLTKEWILTMLKEDFGGLI